MIYQLGDKIVNSVDMFSTDLVKQDTNGQYYIDIAETSLNLSKVKDNDYIISFISLLQSDVHYSYNGANFTARKLYDDGSYFRYRYFASSRDRSFS